MRRTEVQIDNYTGAELDSRLQRIEKALENLSPKQQQQHKYLTRKETAELFSVTERTIQNWSKNGILKALSIGNRIFYRSDDIESSLKLMSSEF